MSVEHEKAEAAGGVESPLVEETQAGDENPAVEEAAAAADDAEATVPREDLEALLFATDTPLTPARLKALFPGSDGKAVRAAVDALEAEYVEQGRAFGVVEFGGGWQLASRPEYMNQIQKLYKGRRYVRLSRAALEVLAIIAYRQPVTRMEIEEIRGVQVSGVLQTLTERNLVTVVGRSDAVGNPILYGTTRDFLNHMGLKGLHQLPELPELEGVIEDRDAVKDFARQLGQELQDDDLETVRVQGDEILVMEAAAPEVEEAAEETDADVDETTSPESEDAPDAEPADDDEAADDERP